MREQILDDVSARKFLLGQLSPEEQGRIEELAFDDTEIFTLLESVEDDLIDDFIQGELSADEKRRFKSHFLSLPGRQENLKISRVMRRHFDETEIEEPVKETDELKKKIADDKKTSFFDWLNPNRFWIHVSLTAAILALVIIAVWLFLRARVAEQPVPIQAGNDKPVVIPSPDVKVSPSLAPTQSPVQAENKPKPSPRERQRNEPALATLLPGSSRSEAPQQLSLPVGAENVPVDLHLSATGRYKTYEARLESEGGTVLRSWPDLKSSKSKFGRALRIDVPADLLKPQYFYRVVVHGTAVNGKVTEVHQYPFEAIK